MPIVWADGSDTWRVSRLPSAGGPLWKFFQESELCLLQLLGLSCRHMRTVQATNSQRLVYHKLWSLHLTIYRGMYCVATISAQQIQQRTES